MIPFICESFKKMMQMSSFTKQKQTLENKLMVPSGEDGGGIVRRLGISTHTL